MNLIIKILILLIMILIFHKYQIFYYFNILLQYINNDNSKKIHSINIHIKFFFLVTNNKLNNLRTILKFSLDTFLNKEQFYRFYLWK